MKIIQTELLTPASIQRMSSTEREWVYNGLDCCLTYEIDDELELVMDDIARGTYQMSLALQAPVLEMNMRGILVDLAQRDKAIAQLKADAIKVDGNFDKLCRSIFGREVNSASPKQCIDLFYNWLGLPEQKKRNTKGEYVATTDREALEKLASIYYPAKPFVSHILKSRDIWKQVGTLETPLLNGRFYTSLSVAGTKTGRLASALSDFAVGSNLQNIDRRIKRMFIADPGKKFANVDLERRPGTSFHSTGVRPKARTSSMLVRAVIFIPQLQ
jgi:DNA polymerase I-like protein with 3'-5' exonuclease and polymerase domains